MAWVSISLFAGFLKKENSWKLWFWFSQNGSPKGFFWLNMKNFETSVLTANSRYLQTAALKYSKDWRVMIKDWLISISNFLLSNEPLRSSPNHFTHSVICNIWYKLSQHYKEKNSPVLTQGASIQNNGSWTMVAITVELIRATVRKYRPLSGKSWKIDFLHFLSINSF